MTPLTHLELSRYTTRELQLLLGKLKTRLALVRAGSRAHAVVLLDIHNVQLFLARQRCRLAMRL
jgi:hypothetical protein